MVLVGFFGMMPQFRNRVRLLFLILVIAMFPSVQQGLLAQDNVLLLGCDCPLVRIDDAYCAATLVFEGIPLSTDTIFSVSNDLDPDVDPIDHVELLFDVQRWLKGTARKKVIISTSFERDECAFRFIIGKPYLVFASMEQELMVTDRCTPTRPMETLGRQFLDSLEYVRAGNRWEGHVPLDIPCN